MNTDLLFYKEPYLRECRGMIQQVEQESGGMWATELDRTCFYPEGGGQPCDLGTIAGVPLVKVEKRDGRVLHFSNTPPGRQGDEVECVVDWDRRYDYMQQHTGQHIISGVLHHTFGYTTVGVHMGELYTGIEIDTPDFTPQEVSGLEQETRRLIRENRNIRGVFIHREDDDQHMPVNSSATPSAAAEGNGPDSTDILSRLRKEPAVAGGAIRVVEIVEYDAVGCGGVHLRSTGEAGPVKLVGIEKIRGRVRLLWKIGQRAEADYDLKHQVVTALGGLFSAPPEELQDKAEKQVRTMIETRREADMLETKLAEKCAELLRLRAETGSITGTFTNEGKDFIRKTAEFLRSDYPVCLVNLTSDRGLQWIIALPDGTDIPFNREKEALLGPIAGKGGGKPPFRQGMGQNPDGVDEFFNRFRQLADGGT